MIKKTPWFLISGVMALSSCQYQNQPKPLPVFDFRQGEASLLNPPSYYACGDILFPCANQSVLIIKREKQHVINRSIQK